MLALRERLQAMVDGGHRVAGAFDDHVDRRMAHQRLPIVADERGAALARVVQRFGRRALRRPADTLEVGPRRSGRQIGNADQMHARRARNLRQVHRAELAGADETDANRLAIGLALLKFAVQTHCSGSALLNTGLADCSAAKSRPGRQQRFGEAVGAAHRLPCGARPCGPSHNSLRSLRSLRSDRVRQVRSRGALRARATGPPLLGAPQARCHLPGRGFAEPTVVCDGRPPSRPSRQAVPGRGDLWGGEEHRAGVGARSALRDLTRRTCPSAVSAANVASCAARPQAEHRSEVGAKRRPPQHEPLPGTACRDAQIHTQADSRTAEAPVPRAQGRADLAAAQRHAACLASAFNSLDVTSALAGIPLFQGRSTG